MITRKELCKLILKHKLNVVESVINDDVMKEIIKKRGGDELVYESSVLGICMDELGLIDDPQCQEYINSRAGVLMFNPYMDGQCDMLTLRDLLDSMKE